MIKVLHPGLFTTVQDIGRAGFRKQGVPLSGAMDLHSAALANTIVENLLETAVFECTAQGPTLLFTEKAQIAICGGTFKCELDGVTLPMNKEININAGSTLAIGLAHKGMRTYIAIKGGFVSQKVLGSRSYYSGITKKSSIQRGDIFEIGSTKISENNNAIMVALDYSSKIINVFPGPEFKMLSEVVQQKIEQQDFIVSPQSNRMGYLLDGLKNVTVSEILTAPVQVGTVQLTPSGSLIVLMRDAQVTGGYARVLQLSEDSINKLAQKRGGDMVKFRLVDF